MIFLDVAQADMELGGVTEDDEDRLEWSAVKEEKVVTFY